MPSESPHYETNRQLQLLPSHRQHRTSGEISFSPVRTAERVDTGWDAAAGEALHEVESGSAVLELLFSLFDETQRCNRILTSSSFA